MGIRKRGGAILAEWTDASGWRHSRSVKIKDWGSEKRACEVAEALVSREKQQRFLVRTELATVEQVGRKNARHRPISRALTAYLAYLRREGRTEPYIAEVERAINTTCDIAGWRFVGQIGEDGLQRVSEHFIKLGRSRRTAVKCYADTTRAFRRWVIEGPRRRAPREEPRRPSRALEPLEAWWLLETCPARRALIWRMMLFTGLRAGELSRLTWSMVDLDREGGGVLRLPASITKNRRAAVLPLAAHLAELLRERRGKRLMPAALVFRSIPTMRTWKRDLERARAAWLDEKGATTEERKRRARSALLTYRTADGQLDRKALRKTFRTWLARAGVDRDPADLLQRHESTLSVQVYLDRPQLEETLRRAVERLVRWFERSVISPRAPHETARNSVS